MLQTFYNGISGVKTNQFGIDSWSSNIANVNTYGYKANLPTFSSIFANSMDSLNASSPVSNDNEHGATTASNAIDTKVGSFVDGTDSTFSMAISQKGWFVVGNKTTATPSLQYTRDGSFSRNADGYLTTSSGQYVYGVDLGKIKNGELSNNDPTDPTRNDGLKVQEVTALTPLQIPSTVYYRPSVTTKLNTSINLNGSYNPKSVESLFTKEADVLDTSKFGLQDFNTLKSSSGTALTSSLAAGDTISVIINKGLANEQTLMTLTYGTDFTTMKQFMSAVTSNSSGTVQATYDGTDKIKFTAIDASNTLSSIAFESSRAGVIDALGLATPTSQTTAKATFTTTALDTSDFTSRETIFDEESFAKNDFNSIFNGSQKTLDIQTGDYITVNLDTNPNDSTVGTNYKFVYGEGTDSTNTFYFKSVSDFMTKVNTLSALEVKLTDLSGESNCRFNFFNPTANDVAISFSSNNSSLISKVGLNGDPVLLTPKTKGSSTSMISSEALTVPSYSASYEVYDELGDKYILKTDYVLFQSGTTESKEIWNMSTSMYDSNNNLVRDYTAVKSSLVFSDAKSAPDLYNASNGEGSVVENLDIPFQTGTISYNPTQYSDTNFSTNLRYSDSYIRNKEADGNPQGYTKNIGIDTNGAIIMSFTNGLSETIGRIGVVGFTNDQGLKKTTSTMYELSYANVNGTSQVMSGLPYVMWDETTGALKSTEVLQGKLEMSNVELSTALTELMVMQRAYSASAKTITTGDELIKEAIGLKR